MPGNPQVIPAIVALAVSACLGPLVLSLLRRAAVIDVPNERSSHTRATLRGGGIAVALAATAAIVVPSGVPGAGRVALAAFPLAFGVLGMFDDVRPVSAVRRLAIQIGLGGLTAWLALDHLGGSVAWRLAAVLAVALWVTAVVNAWNFMDGIDGLATGTAAVAGLSWWLIGDAHGVRSVAVAGGVLAGAALGFLPLNFPRARVFLGDVGSYFLGAWAAVVVVLGLRAGIAPEAMVAPLSIFLADTGITLIRRLRRRESLHVAHRDHAYQQLVDRGWSHVRTSLVLLALTGICGALGFSADGAEVPGRVSSVIGIGLVALGSALIPHSRLGREAARPAAVTLDLVAVERLDLGTLERSKGQVVAAR